MKVLIFPITNNLWFHFRKMHFHHSYYHFVKVREPFLYHICIFETKRLVCHYKQGMYTPGRVWRRRQWLWRRKSEWCSTWMTFKIGSWVCLWFSQKYCPAQHDRSRNAKFSFKIWKFLFKRKIIWFKANEHDG